MDKQILALYARRKDDELKSFIKSSGLQPVTQCLVQYIQSGKPSIVELLEAILSGYPSHTLRGSEGRLSIYKACLHAVNATDIAAKTANDVIGLLLLQVDTLGEDALVEIISMLLDMIRSGDSGISRFHPILSKMLSVVGTLAKVTVDGADLTGLAYKDQLINSICSVKWDPKVVLHLVSMFREVSLSDSELLFVLDKVLRSLTGLTEPHEIPPLVSQVLLLSCKGHRRFVIEKVCNFFGLKDKEIYTLEGMESDAVSETDDVLIQMMHAQGTALLHFVFSIKQDPEMGKEFVKYLKSSLSTADATRMLHPFVIAVAMAMTNVNRFESQITDTLKSAVLKSYRNRLVAQSSPWARDALHRCEQASKEKMKAQAHLGDALLDVFVRTVRYSATGSWDAVVPGFVHLGFALMDAYGPKGSAGCPAVLQATAVGAASSACRLGAKILLTTFESHEIARQSILDHIICRVVMQSTSPSLHFLDLLSDSVKAVPQAVLDCLPRIREALEHLTMLPYATAERLLHTVQPLLKVSASLRDATLITLRKAIFGRSVEERKMAVTGFLMVLKNFKILGGMATSQTQVHSIALSQVSVHSSGSAGDLARVKAFCLDVLGTLRRSLALQAEVRHCLYEGLYGVLSSNTQLCGPILDLLLAHMMPYVGLHRSSSATLGAAAVAGPSSVTSKHAPLNLKTCITHQADQVCVSEPLSHLVSCVARCGLKAMDIVKANGADDEDEHGSAFAVRQIQNVFSSLSDSLASSNPEDFELDPAADFSPSSNVGLVNSLKVLLALGVYEAVIEYEVSAGRYQRDACDRALALFEKHQALSSLLSEKTTGTAAASKSSSQKVSKPPSTLFTLAFLAETIHSVLMLPNSPSPAQVQSGLKLLRDNQAYLSFFMRALLARLHQVRDKGLCDGFDGKSPDKVFKAICLSTEALLCHCCTACSSLSLTATDSSAVILPAFECIATAFEIVGEWYGDRVAEFLNATGEADCPAEGVSMIEQQATLLIKRLQKCLESILSCQGSAANAPVLSKVAIFLMELLKKVTGWLCDGSGMLKEVYNYVQSLCAKKAVADNLVGKSLMGLLLDLSKMQQCLPAAVRSIAQDLHFILGDVEEEVVVEASHNYACLNEQNSAPVMQLVLTSFDADLDAVNWLLEELHGLLPPLPTAAASAGHGAPSSSAPSAESGNVQQEEGQKAAVNRLGVLALGLYDLIQTAVPFGPASEALIKSQIKLHVVLANLMKYFLQLCNRRCDLGLSRLEKLVKLVGTQLTPYVYSFITYMQAMQSEHLKSYAQKKKGKAKLCNVSNVGKAQVRKESKFIPNLIFAIEQYERFLTQLAKKLKVNFMDYVKLSTSRDFRINPASLQAALQQQEADDSEEQSQDAANKSANASKHTSANENQPPAAKKTKKMDVSKASTSAGKGKAPARKRKGYD